VIDRVEAPAACVAGSWVDPAQVANQREDARDHEAHRNRIRAVIPNILTFRRIRIP
jgi:hypothetical protein